MAPLAKFSKKEKGYSLIEVLVALLLMQLVLLVLMESAVLIMNTNLRSKLRDMGVTITEAELERLRGKPFTDPEVQASTATRSATRTIGKATYTYTMTVTIQNVASNADLRTIQILTTWSFLGKSFSHSATQLIKQ